MAKDIDDFELKKEVHRLEVFKFIVTGIILSLATFISTCTFKSYELKIQTRKEESALLKPYLDKYLELIEKDSLKYDRALDMVDFVKIISIDEDIKSSWTSFGAYLTEKLIKIKHLNDSLKLAARSSNDSIAEQQAKLRAIQKQVSRDKTYKPQFKKDSVKIVSAIDSFNNNLIEANNMQQKLAAEASKVIARPQTFNINIPSAKENYKVIYDQNRWAGKGYMNSIIEDIVVNVDSFSDTKAQMRITSDSVKSIEIAVGETKIVTFNEKYRITITLIAIKNMGRKFVGALSKEASYRIKVEKKLVD